MAWCKETGKNKNMNTVDCCGNFLYCSEHAYGAGDAVPAVWSKQKVFHGNGKDDGWQWVSICRFHAEGDAPPEEPRDGEQELLDRMGKCEVRVDILEGKQRFREPEEPEDRLDFQDVIRLLEEEIQDPGKTSGSSCCHRTWIFALRDFKDKLLELNGKEK